MPWNLMNCWSSAENRSVPEAIVAVMLPASVGMAALMTSLWVGLASGGADGAGLGVPIISEPQKAV